MNAARIMDLKTTLLLKEVADQLISFQSFTLYVESKSAENDYLYHRLKMETYLNEVKELIGDKGKNASEITRLFCAVDHTLRRFMLIPTRRNAFNISYTGGIVKYQPREKVNHKFFLDVSILTEREDENTVKYYHLLTEISVNAKYYSSIQIDPELAPSFADDNDSINKDIDSWSKLSNHISKYLNKNCWHFAQFGKFSRKEYGNPSRALDPFLPAEDALKNQEATTSLQCALKKRKTNKKKSSVSVEVPNSSIYNNLLNKFSRCNPKPNEVSRLFAVICNVFKLSNGYKTCKDFSDWPGEPLNDGVLYIFKYSRKERIPVELVDFVSNAASSSTLQAPSGETVEGEVTDNFFSVACMTNRRDFFVSVRLPNMRSCLLKVTKRLIPSFEVAEKELDNERISNIDMWIQDVESEFIGPVVKESNDSKMSGSSSRGSSRQ